MLRVNCIKAIGVLGLLSAFDVSSALANVSPPTGMHISADPLRPTIYNFTIKSNPTTSRFPGLSKLPKIGYEHTWRVPLASLPELMSKLLRYGANVPHRPLQLSFWKHALLPTYAAQVAVCDGTNEGIEFWSEHALPGTIPSAMQIYALQVKRMHLGDEKFSQHLAAQVPFSDDDIRAASVAMAVPAQIATLYDQSTIRTKRIWLPTQAQKIPPPGWSEHDSDGERVWEQLLPMPPIEFDLWHQLDGGIPVILTIDGAQSKG